jgi:hypothetical protein
MRPRYVSSAAVMVFGDVASLKPKDLSEFLDRMISEAIERSDFRMSRYRAASVGIRILGIALAGSATIILGVSNLPPLANVAFSFTAIITLVNSLEPFFNLRSIWVIQEEALASFRGLHEELRFHVAGAVNGEVDHESLRIIFQRYEQIWAASSSSWIGERRSAKRDLD